MDNYRFKRPLSIGSNSRISHTGICKYPMMGNLQKSAPKTNPNWMGMNGRPSSFTVLSCPSALSVHVKTTTYMCFPNSPFILSFCLEAFIHRCLQMNAHRHSPLSDLPSDGHFHLCGNEAMKGWKGVGIYDLWFKIYDLWADRLRFMSDERGKPPLHVARPPLYVGKVDL